MWRKERLTFIGLLDTIYDSVVFKATRIICNENRQRQQLMRNKFSLHLTRGNIAIIPKCISSKLRGKSSFSIGNLHFWTRNLVKRLSANCRTDCIPNFCPFSLGLTLGQMRARTILTRHRFRPTDALSKDAKRTPYYLQNKCILNDIGVNLKRAKKYQSMFSTGHGCKSDKILLTEGLIFAQGTSRFSYNWSENKATTSTAVSHLFNIQPPSVARKGIKATFPPAFI